MTANTRPTGAWIIRPWPGSGLERHIAEIYGAPRGKLGPGPMEYSGDAVWDQIRSFKIDVVDLIIRELALAGVDVLKRHQEDHGRLRLFVGLVEQSAPSVRSQPHGARESIDPRFPHDFVTIGINLVDRFDPKRAVFASSAGFGEPRQIVRHKANAAQHEILRAAEEEKADLVVLSTHGRTGASKLLIGSVTEHVLKNAAVDVLALPAVHDA